MTPSDHRLLTPADVQDLRDSVRYRVSNGQGDPTAHILYLPAEDRFLLRVDCRPMCASADITLLAACLRAERAEPGFVARIMDPAVDCRVASLAPDIAAAERRRLAGLNAEIAERARSDAERKRQSHIAGRVDVSKISLDDLL